MLVLTRKLMEKLYIGDDICVTVVRLEGGQVRLGIEAPRAINVVRAELVPEREGIRTRSQDMRADAALTSSGTGRQAGPVRSFLQAPTRRGSWNR